MGTTILFMRGAIEFRSDDRVAISGDGPLTDENPIQTHYDLELRLPESVVLELGRLNCDLRARLTLRFTELA